MDALFHDVRYALRLLTKNPSFSAIAILTLALGIGANTAIFSVVNAVLLRPLPFRDPSRLVLALEHNPSIPGLLHISYLNFLDWRDQSHSFESLEATCPTNMTLTGAGGPERLNARFATAGLFPLLGINAIAGRTFTADEDRPSGPQVALLTYGLWQRRFGGSPDILGQRINLDSRSYTVVGVLSAGFQIITPVDVFVPFMPWAKTLPDDRDWHPGITPIGRLKPGISLDRARSEIVNIAKRLEQQYPLYNTGVRGDVVRLQDQLVQNVRPALLLLLGAVSFVLLIACANVANLLLARAASRAREVAIRSSMGASRPRIVQQFLTESVLVSLLGGALGLFLGWIALPLLLKLSAGSVPQIFTVTLDRSVLTFTLILSVLTGFSFGIAPALRAVKRDLRERLNESSRGSTAGPGLPPLITRSLRPSA
jgi:putative ABC transport system permease protein